MKKQAFFREDIRRCLNFEVINSCLRCCLGVSLFRKKSINLFEEMMKHWRADEQLAGLIISSEKNKHFFLKK